MSKKIKVAGVKFNAFSAGATQKFLQTILAHLPKDKFQVDLFGCDFAPYVGSDHVQPGTDPTRVQYLKDNDVNIIELNVGYKDVRTPTHDWLEHDFWDKFNEDDYDLIVSARAGHPEYPFTHIHKTPIIDIITLPGMAERKENSKKVIHISNFQAKTWIDAGGDASKIEIVPIISEFEVDKSSDLRKELGIDAHAFVFGMHQRPDSGIYSEIALNAYKHIEQQHQGETAFVMLGGAKEYREQAKRLGLSDFTQLDFDGDYKKVQKFLATIDAFSHARSDGETFGLAIAEAMAFSKPIISHIAPALGMIETIGNGGVVTKSMDEYVNEMNRLMADDEYYRLRSDSARAIYNQCLSIEANMPKIERIFEEVHNQINLDEMNPDDFWNEME